MTAGAGSTIASLLLATRDTGPFHVGVLLDNIPEFSFLLGAAALARATVVALNRTRTAVQLARDLAATDCRLVLTQERHLPPPPAADTFYVAMPLFHSNALIAGWVPALAQGGCVALRPRFSASAFLDGVRRYGATYANYVGKPLSYVLAQPERAGDADNPLRLVFGNEASDQDIARFSRRFGCQVIDGFGSTEGGVSIFRDERTPPGSLGRPVGDVRVLDPDTGAERAAVAFDADGYLYFAGRAADRLRVDGENLSTAAIERVLARYPAVQVAVVYAVPDPAVGDQVMAALLLPGGRTLDPAAFGDWLAEQPDLSRKEWPHYRLVIDLEAGVR